LRTFGISRRPYLACVALGCLLSVAVLGQQAKIETMDGLTVVHNPKRPVKKAGAFSSLGLTRDLSIGNTATDEDSMFSTIGGVMVDDDEDIIVIDEKELVIKIFDKNGRHVRTFGKRGQGPGEFQSAARIVLKGGRDIAVLDSANHRFSYYSKEGECLKEISLGKYSSIRRAKPDSRGHIYADTTTMDGGTVTDTIMRFDPEFHMMGTVAEAERVMKPYEVDVVPEWFMFTVMDDDRFVWGRNTKYELTILDPDGKPVKRIIKDYAPVKISEAERKRLIKERFGDFVIPASYKVVFPEHFPPFLYFICDDLGRLYVRTYQEDARGSVQWDVFDEEGLYILSLFLPPDELLYCIRKGKAYTFSNENEAGLPVVLRYRMDWR
jgi:hypothetical protein